MKYLTNAPYNPHGKRDYTLLILEDDPTWSEAYDRWKKQQNPTDHPEWKLGIYFGTDWNENIPPK